MNWMKAFDEATLELAYADWSEGCLEDLSITDGDGRAWVGDGKDTYVVEFSLDDNQEPADLFCDCSKATEGVPCKHMAVVCFQLDEDKKSLSIAHLVELSAPSFLDEYEAKHIDFFLGLCDPDLLHGFLLYLLNEDRSLLKLFWHGMHINMEEEPDAIIETLKDLICRFEESHFFSDYYEAEIFINEAIRLFVLGAYILDERKDIVGLFDFSHRFFSELDIDVMGDHWDQLDLLCQTFLVSWRMALDKSSPRERQIMLRWYQDWQGLGGESIQLFNDVLEEFFRLPAFGQKSKMTFTSKRGAMAGNSISPLLQERRPKETVLALYPQELLTDCEERAEALASSAANRQHYRNLVDFLREIRRIEGGNLLVDALVTRWRIEYKRRYALQEELDKL